MNNILSRTFFVLFIFFIVFFIVCQIYMKRNYTDNLKGWCEEYSEEWHRVYQDGTIKQVQIPINENGNPGEDIVLETILPDKIADDAVFCMVVGRNTWFYVDGELRGQYLDSDSPFPGGMVKNRIVQIELSQFDSGKTLRIVRNDAKKNIIGISGAYIGNSHGIYNYFNKEYGIQMSMSILLTVLSVLSMIVIVFISLKDKKINNIIHLCCGIFLLGVWEVFDNNMFQYKFGTYFIDGIITYFAIMIAPFFFIYYLDKAQNGRYGKLYGILNLLLLINILVFGILHFTSVINFADSMIFMNLFLSVAIAGIGYTLVHDFYSGNIKEYKYIAIGLFLLAICGILEIIFINITKSRITDGLFIVVGLFILLIMAIVQIVKQSEMMKTKAINAMRANKLKSNFLANMSHEIRTPLNAIMGLNQMINIESDNAVVKEYSANIKSAGESLLSIIGDILDFSMIESGKMEICEVQYDVKSLINDLENSIRVNSDKKGLDFNIVIDKNLPCTLSGDEKRIKQIGINLLSNAVKYTEKGFIRLDVSGKGEKDNFILVLTVSDSGIGIKEEDKDRLFRKFERISSNRNIEGTGLGLSITGNLVELMKGTITVESEYQKGSVFSVELPQGIIDETPIGLYQSHENHTDITPDITKIMVENVDVLVVDDNNMNLMVAKGLLKNSGMNVDTCGSGREMLDIITKKYYDVILLDHMMPEMDGIEAMKAARKLENNKCADTPIIVMTANAIKGVREQYIEAGFADYISKPVSGEQLVNTIANHIDKNKKSDVKQKPVKTRSMSDLPDLPEFDLKYAMNLVGDKDILIEFLIDYAIYIKGIGSKIIELMDDTNKFEILVHSIKSSSANVGALTISRLARLLEIAAKENNREKINTLTPVLLEELETHYNTLKSLIPQEERSIREFDKNMIKEILSDLKNNLEQFDYSDAEENMKKLIEFDFSSEQAAYVNEIASHIDEFEQNRAIETIDRLLNFMEV